MTPYELASDLMRRIMYDNGMVDRFRPESQSIEWAKVIAPIAQKFFDANPDLLTDEHLDNITAGEYSENLALYSHLAGWKELDNALNAFFDGDIEDVTALTEIES